MFKAGPYQQLQYQWDLQQQPQGLRAEPQQILSTMTKYD